jgi:hypothetical protein
VTEKKNFLKILEFITFSTVGQINNFLVIIFFLAKTPLQNRFTLLMSKFFPAKFSFYKIQKKNLAGKNTLQKSEFYFVKK